jgi:DNA-binding transcriptional LysR family regulator
MRWDDLKYLLAVADGGGLAPAARALGVDASTVSRRLAALEQDLAVELLVRTPEGMSLTEAGAAAAAVAREVEGALAALAGRIAGGREGTNGHVRISATDTFAARVMHAMAPLHAQHPALTIEVVSANAAADLRRREADIALRFFREEHDGLAMRKLGHMGWSLYASPAYLAGRPHGSGLLEGHAIIGYVDELKRATGPRWLLEHAAPEATRLRCNGPRAAMEAALAGIGVALLPCYLVEGPPLVRLTDQVLVVTEAWAVFLPERKEEPRIRLVIDALADMFASAAAAFSGRMDATQDVVAKT